MEPTKANKFEIFLPWPRIEVDNNSAITNITVDFLPWGFRVDITKFHVLSRVQHIKCLA